MTFKTIARRIRRVLDRRGYKKAREIWKEGSYFHVLFPLTYIEEMAKEGIELRGTKVVDVLRIVNKMCVGDRGKPEDSILRHAQRIVKAIRAEDTLCDLCERKMWEFIAIPDPHAEGN